MTTDQILDGPAGPIAVRDFGGTGQPVVLLHGSGGNLATMGLLARPLATTHRVISVDLRGHGLSGDGPWEWDAVLDDLSFMVAALRLDRPAMVGMSLGGILAALWGARHPECPAIVSLDGNPPPTDPGQLPGLPDAAAELARLRTAFAEMVAGICDPLSPEQVDAAIAAQRATAARYDSDEELWVESFTRNLTNHPEGVRGWPRRPGVLDEVRAALESVDLATLYGQVKCPALVLLATDDLDPQVPFAALYAAYREFTRHTLTTVAAGSATIRVVPLSGATHAMLAERPDELARLVADFVTPPRSR